MKLNLKENYWVEIDPEIIQLANDYFKLNEIRNRNRWCLWICFEDQREYDLIIIDVFQDTKMPNFLYENYFINRICLLLKSKGFVLFNTMLLNEEHNLRNKNIFQISAPLITPLKRSPSWNSQWINYYWKES
jgi:spermidine synthase